MPEAPPSASLAPPPAIVPSDARPEAQTPRPEPPRYLLAITVPGVPGAQYVLRGQLVGRPMFCLDRHRAHSWENATDPIEWLRTLPESVLNGYRGRHLFVVKARTEALEIAGSYEVKDAPRPGTEGGAPDA